MLNLGQSPRLSQWARNTGAGEEDVWFEQWEGLVQKHVETGQGAVDEQIRQANAIISDNAEWVLELWA